MDDHNRLLIQIWQSQLWQKISNDWPMEHFGMMAIHEMRDSNIVPEFIQWNGIMNYMKLKD